MKIIHPTFLQTRCSRVYSRLLFVFLVALLCGAGEQRESRRKSSKQLDDSVTGVGKGYRDILANYSFVSDFSQKEADREVSADVFWRYPYVLPSVEFPIEFDFVDPSRELPVTKGAGRAIDHLNRGRMFFLENKFTEAKGAWLSGRARYGKEYPEHRRLDYFVGYVFLQLARQMMRETDKNYEDPTIKNHFANASTFLEWAFVLKADQSDPLLDSVSPKGLYNLAAIKWRYGRFAGAFGAAEAGLNFLRKSGRKDYRAQFHRMIAEAHIKNQSYLEAVQVLDQAIRQDQDLAQSAASFARVGDIYFDLNNYELAEDAYSLGAKIDEELKQISPAQLVLRGESLFWLGKFSESQSALHLALEGQNYRHQTAALPEEFRPWASLRIADGYLARAIEAREAAINTGLVALKREDSDNLCGELEKAKSVAVPGKSKLALSRYCGLIDKAKLAYFRVANDHSKIMPGQIANLRSACLELPYYGGHNIRHAREFLEQVRGGDLPPQAIELGWACQVASYTQRERTVEMLDRVKKFYEAHPGSRFLASFVEPVREFQGRKIDNFFAENDSYGAISFFELNRKTLFPKVDDVLAAKLFVAYADVFLPEKAKEFWPAYQKVKLDTDIGALRDAVLAAELVDLKAGKEWDRRSKEMSASLQQRKWEIVPDSLALGYFRRLLQVSTLEIHLDWLLNLVGSWSKINSDYACDVELPLLARVLNEGKHAAESRAFTRLSSMIESKLPALFKVDSSCALSMLEIEQKYLRQHHRLDALGKLSSESRLPGLAARYLARQDWPLIGDFLHMYWTVAEHIHDDGDVQSAKLLWQVLRDKGPADAMESRFARARLDPTRTETERLWD